MGFDADQLPAALAELDRLYMASVDPERALFTYAHSVAHRRISSKVPTCDSFTSDYTMVDHRNIGWEVIEGRAAYEERLATLLNTVDEFTYWATHVQQERSPVGSFSGRLVGLSSDGAAFDDRFHMVVHTDPATGMLVRVEQFAEDDKAAALARCDELSAERDRARLKPNDAVFVGGRANLAAIFTDEETFLGCFADGFTATLADGTTIDKGHIERGDVDPSALGYGGDRRTVVTVTAGRLATIRITDDDGDVRYAVEEIDEQGRLTAVFVTPAASVADALAWHSRRVVDVRPPELRRISRTSLDMSMAVEQGDADALQRLTTPAFRVVDHRRLGYGSMDRDEWIEFIRSNASATSWTVVKEYDLTCRPAGVINFVSVWEGTEHLDDTISYPSIVVNLVEGDKVVGVEFFDEEDQAAALARLAEHEARLAAPPAQTTPASRPTTATRTFEQAVTHLAAGNVDRFATLLAPDFVEDSRRALFRFRLDRAEFVEGLGVFFEQALTSHSETLAVAGDLDLLERREIGSDDEIVGAMYVVSSVDEAGLITRMVDFDEDALDDAVAELRRIHFDRLDPIERAQYEIFAETEQGIATGDLERAVAFAHPRVTARDHRELGWGVGGDSEYRQRIATLTEHGGFVQYQRGVTHDSPWRSWFDCRVTSTVVDDAVLTDDFIAILEIDPPTGMTIGMDSFATDDVESANRRWDELAAEAAARIPQPNQAVIAGGAANVRARRPNGTAALLSGLAHDFTAEGVGPDDRSVTCDDLVDPTFDLTHVGLGITDRHVIGVYGDHVALLYIDLGDNERRWSVEVTDGSGLLQQIRHFPADDLLAASTWAFDVGGAAGARSAALRVVQSWTRLIRTTDNDGVAAMLADDFELVDHRPLEIDHADRAGWIAHTPDGPHDHNDHGIITAQQIHLATDHVVVASSARIQVAESGDLYEGGRGIFVVGVRNDVIARIETFEDHDLDAAMTRARELEVELGGRPDEEYWNEADRLTRVAETAWSKGDQAAVAPLIADDCVIDDRRRIVGHRYEGRAAVMTGLEPSRNWTLGITTVAVRDDDLVLHLEEIHPDDDPEGVAIEYLQITRLGTDGRCDLQIMFDPDDLEAAIAELELLHAQSIDPIERHAAAGYHRVDTWMATGDIDRMMRSFADHFVIDDHRRLGWGAMGVGPLRQRLQSFSESIASGLIFEARIYRLSASARCSLRQSNTVTAEGASITHQSIVVIHSDPIGGLTHRMDQYDLDHVDDAIRRFEELSALDGDHRIANSAVVATSQLCQRRDPRWVDDAVELLASEFHAHLVGAADAITLDDVRRGVVTVAQLGFDPATRQLVAVRGRRLALMSFGQEGAETWTLECVTENGLLESVEHFPTNRLADAVHALDQRHLELFEGNEVVGVQLRRLFDFHRALNTGDLDGAMSVFSPAVTVVDHRPLGWGAESRYHDLQERFRTITDADGQIVDFPRVLHRLDEHGGAMEFRVVSTTPEGSRLVNDHLVIWRADPATEMTIRFEEFSLERLDDALALFDESIAREPVTGSFDGDTIDPAFLARLTPALRDQAHVVVDMAVAVAAADVDRLDTLLADDFHTDDLRPLGWGPRDRAAFLESVADRPRTLGVGRITGTLHRLVDGVAVTEYEVETHPYGDSAPIVERGIAVMTVRSGQLTWMGLHPDDQLDAAIARFDEIASALGDAASSRIGPAGNEPWNRADRLTRGWLASDDWTALVADEGVTEDRRAGLATVYTGRDEVLAGWAIVGEMSAEHTTLAARGDDVVLTSVVLWLEGQRDVSEVGALRVDRWNVDDLLERSVVFDPDDLSAAVVELNRLALTGADAIGVGDAALMSALEAITEHDVERSQLHFHPEFEHVDHRAIGWATTNRDEFMARSTSLRELTARVTYFIPRLERGSHPAALLAQYCLRGTTELGVELEHWSLLVSEIDVANRHRPADGPVRDGRPVSRRRADGRDRSGSRTRAGAAERCRDRERRRQHLRPHGPARTVRRPIQRRFRRSAARRPDGHQGRHRERRSDTGGPRLRIRRA